MADGAKMHLQGALRRAILAADGDRALLQDQIDAAELAIAAGEKELAASLYGAVALQRGFGSETTAMLADANERAQLWSTVVGARAGRPSGFAFDVAVEELRQLMRLSAQPSFPELWDGCSPAMIEPGVMASSPDHEALALAEQIAAIVRHCPEREPSASADDLRGLADRLMNCPAVRLNEHVALPVDDLVSLLVLERVRRFVVTNLNLLQARPPQLFVAVGQLTHTGLGPYFSNVSLLIRSARDLFALVEGAADGLASPDLVETWCTLLAAHLRHHHVNELISDLGDRGMLRALSGVLFRLTQPGPQEHWHDALRKLRDVALDLEEHKMAARAQRFVAQRHRTDAGEWRILGDIHAAAGEISEAEQAYRKALFLSPGDPAAQLAMAALRGEKAGASYHHYETHVGSAELRRLRAADYRSADRPGS